jgi:hypothetical protein
MMKNRRVSEKTAVIFTITAAACIVLSAVLAVILHRAGVFAPRLSEKAIAGRLDLTAPDAHGAWPEELAELNLPSYKKDFPIYGAFTYTGRENTLTLVYATRAKIGDIREHYRGLLENASESGSNDEGRLNLTGTAGGREIAVTNYFSEVSVVIRADIQMTGDASDLIRKKITAAFPEHALAGLPEIAAFAANGSDSGYVLYDYNTLAGGPDGNTPVFSRAYFFDGGPDELREQINALGARFTDPASARISGGEAMIRHDGYVYQVKPLVDGERTKVVLVIQAMPGAET